MIFLLRCVLITSVLSLGFGCATVIEGGDQVINITTTGCEDHNPVRCTALNDDGSSVITAPASVSVDKDKDSLTISCKSVDGVATGELILESKYEAWNAGNILIGGIIGIGVDAATGAMWKYPSAVVVPLKCSEGQHDSQRDGIPSESTEELKDGVDAEESEIPVYET